MNNSSKIKMEQVFEHLAKIEMAEPNIDLYAQILTRLKKKNIIPLFWVRTAACLLIVFVATAFYVTSNNENTPNRDLSAIIYKTNNILYNE